MYTTVHQPYPYSELDLGAMSSVAAGELVGVFGCSLRLFPTIIVSYKIHQIPNDAIKTNTKDIS